MSSTTDESSICIDVSAPVPLWISDVAPYAINYYPESIAIGTLSEDSDHPALCRMVYMTFTQRGRIRMHLANLAVDGYKFDEPTKSSRNGARGLVSLDETHLFCDLEQLPKTNEAIGKWVFDRLRAKGITEAWGVGSYDDLRSRGKQPIQSISAIGTAPRDSVWPSCCSIES